MEALENTQKTTEKILEDFDNKTEEEFFGKKPAGFLSWLKKNLFEKEGELVEEDYKNLEEIERALDEYEALSDFGKN